VDVWCYAPSTTAIHPLSLHDALPIYARHRRHRRLDADVVRARRAAADAHAAPAPREPVDRGALRDGEVGVVAFEHAHVVAAPRRDRKSTRLNSSHVKISYAVFCLKKK